MYKLDKTDKNILYQLDLNSRTPTSKIARKLKTSRMVVDYRIKKMQDAGIIRAFTTMFDPCKFGLTGWKVYLKLHNLKPNTEKKMMQYLTKSKNVWWAVKCYGDYNLLYSAVAENFYEFNEVLKEFHQIFGEYIVEEQINNHLEPQYLSRGYLTNQKSKALSKPFMKKPVKEKVNITDLLLMKQLGINSRTPIIKLAKKAKTTPRIASYRIKNLKSRGIIVFYRLSLDMNKLGRDFYKGLLYLKNTEEKDFKSIIEYCKQNKHINEVVKSVGAWQLEVEIEARDFKHFNEILEELKIQFPKQIVRTEHVLIYEEAKVEFNFMDYYHKELQSIAVKTFKNTSAKQS